MNGGIYSTGNEIVDENAKLNISGNIIPQVWYRTIIRESGKPNLTAIIIRQILCTGISLQKSEMKEPDRSLG